MTDEAADVITSPSRQEAVLLAILLSLCSGVAFTAGGLFVCCSTRLVVSRRGSSLASLALVLAFTTSAFVFISGGVADLLPLAQSGFEQLMLRDHDIGEISPETARAMSHLLATTSFTAGVLLLYGVTMTVHKLTVAASACYKNPPVQQGTTDLSDDSSNHHVGLSIIGNPRASSATTDAENDDFGLRSSASVDFKVLQSTDRPWDAELSKDAKGDAFKDQSTRSDSTAHVRASVISVLAIVLHHMPAGSIIYISAMSHFPLGQVLAFAVVLHSIPDGKASASSIYFASGSHIRCLLWSLLCPMGRILGSLAVWGLLLGDDQRTTCHCFLTGMAAGALVAIGVVQILPTACVCADDRSYGLVLGVLLGSVLLALPKVFVE